MQNWWWNRQALDGRLAGANPAKVLEETGWCRSVGGSNPYLALFARAGIDRAQVDAALARSEIQELPSARGCTYIIPKSDFALALTVGQAFRRPDYRTAEKLGVTLRELDKLCKAILDALAAGPVGPDGIKDAVGTAVRNLGEDGKKKGMTTTLSLALGKLQSRGEIRRIPENGRLDQQRYQYQLWDPNPLEGLKWDLDRCRVELARKFFHWIGPATIAEFRGFSGLGVAVAKEAMAGLDLVEIDTGATKESQRRYLPTKLEAEYKKFKKPRAAQYALIGSLDGYFHLRREIADLVSTTDAKLEVLDGKRTKPLGSIRDLPNHGIVERGRLVGLWEYDLERESIVWMSFGKADSALKAAVERTEVFVRDQLGDARAFSLDSSKRRAPRIEALRAAQ